MIEFKELKISFTDKEHSQNQNTVPAPLIGAPNNQELFFGPSRTIIKSSESLSFTIIY